MPFRIDVLDAALSPERQATLAAVLVRDGGVEPELADLVSAMTPGTVAEVATANARDRLVASLAAAGFGVRAGGTASAAPAGRPAVARVVHPVPLVQPDAGGSAVRAVVGVLMLVVIMTGVVGMCGAPQDTYSDSDYDVVGGQADSIESSMEDSGLMMEDTTMMMDETMMEEPSVPYDDAMLEEEGERVADSLRDEANALMDALQDSTTAL